MTMGLNTAKGTIGSIMMKSCWVEGDQELWKMLLASVGVKKRAKEYDEPIEWFLDKYNRAVAKREGFLES